VWGDPNVYDLISMVTRPTERSVPTDPQKTVFEKINHFENAFQIKKLTTLEGKEDIP